MVVVYGLTGSGYGQRCCDPGKGRSCAVGTPALRETTGQTILRGTVPCLRRTSKIERRIWCSLPSGLTSNHKEQAPTYKQIPNFKHQNSIIKSQTRERIPKPHSHSSRARASQPSANTGLWLSERSEFHRPRRWQDAQGSARDAGGFF